MRPHQTPIHPLLYKMGTSMNDQAILDEIHQEFFTCGAVATHIPQQASVSPSSVWNGCPNRWRRRVPGGAEINALLISRHFSGWGIVGVPPNRQTFTVWSPGLNKKDHSFAGHHALEIFPTKTGGFFFLNQISAIPQGWPQTAPDRTI